MSNPEFIVYLNETLAVRLFCDRQGYPCDAVVSPATGRFQYAFANDAFLDARGQFSRKVEDVADDTEILDYARSEDERPLQGYPVLAAYIAGRLNEMPKCIWVPLNSQEVPDPRATALIESIEDRHNPPIVLSNLEQVRAAWKRLLDDWYLPHAGDRLLAYLDKIEEEHEEMLEDYRMEHICPR